MAIVEAVATDDATLEGATVATVAHQLGLDHSGASRMVRDATAVGYLSRGISARDRRRASLKLTESGRELLEGSRRWQRHTFDHLTAGWNTHDRHQLATYLHRLARQVNLD